MLEAKLYIFIEPLFGIMDKVRYITDISDEKINCKMDDLFTILKHEHNFSIKEVEDMRVRLKCGTPLIVDLQKKTFFQYDEGDKILLSKKVVREPKKIDRNSMSKVNKRVENIVDDKYFTQ